MDLLANKPILLRELRRWRRQKSLPAILTAQALLSVTLCAIPFVWLAIVGSQMPDGQDLRFSPPRVDPETGAISTSYRSQFASVRTTSTVRAVPNTPGDVICLTRLRLPDDPDYIARIQAPESLQFYLMYLKRAPDAPEPYELRALIVVRDAKQGNLLFWRDDLRQVERRMTLRGVDRALWALPKFGADEQRFFNERRILKQLSATVPVETELIQPYSGDPQLYDCYILHSAKRHRPIFGETERAWLDFHLRNDLPQLLYKTTNVSSRYYLKQTAQRVGLAQEIARTCHLFVSAFAVVFALALSIQNQIWKRNRLNVYSIDEMNLTMLPLSARRWQLSIYLLLLNAKNFGALIIAPAIGLSLFGVFEAKSPTHHNLEMIVIIGLLAGSIVSFCVSNILPPRNYNASSSRSI